MTGKLMLHTLLCAFIAFSLYLRLRETTWRRTTIVFIVAVVAMGLSPWIYRVLPPGIFPRMTIHFSQLVFLAMAAVWFAPQADGRPRYDAPWIAPEDDPLDVDLTSKPEQRMPLH